MIDGLIQAGAPDDVIEAMRQSMTRATADDDAFEVWPENWDSVILFLRLHTQWRIAAGMGGLVYLGLDYSAIEPAMRLCAIPRAGRENKFDDLQTMERAALQVLNKKD